MRFYRRHLKKYKVRVSPNHVRIATAYSAHGAKEQVWRSFEGGYKYGWESKKDFMRNAKIENE